MKQLILFGFTILAIIVLLKGCKKDDTWDPNNYTIVVMNSNNNAYDFTIGFISISSIGNNFDGILNEPWCTELPALCGNFEITDVSSFAALSAPPSGSYSNDCLNVPLNTVLVFRLDDGSYALVMVVDDVYTENETGCVHEITLHVNYPAFDGNTSGNDGPVTGTFTDVRDNHIYKTVQIGNQTWMAENLAWLPVVNPSSVGYNTEPNYYVHGYQGTSVSAAKATDNYETYGVLYNWPAAINACPSGWALPTDEEWKQLEMFTGMSQSEADGEGYRGTDEGKKLKSKSGWLNNGNGTDEYGFCGLPGGYRNGEGFFKGISEYGDWWSAPEIDNNTACYRNLNYNTTKVHRANFMKNNGFSVRCIKKDYIYGYITDARDGHTYKTIQIGEQNWLAENMAYLPGVSPSSTGSNSESIYYVYGYEGTNTNEAKTTENFQTYGALYNWHASLTACPDGWHLPDDEEWKQLEMYIGMNGEEVDNTGWRGADEGNRLKATSGWLENGNGTDEYGFGALPGGSRFSSGYFNTAGEYGNWWSATEYGLNSLFRHLRNSNSDIYRNDYIRENGFSVRCVEGEPSGGNTGIMTDPRDGIVYTTVKIGNQVWTVENLKTTTYNDGTPIPNVTDDNTWRDLTTGAYCNYGNLESNVEIYGRLYNWHAVNTGKLAPAGWHVPTYDDWIVLADYLIANGYNHDGTKDENKIAKSLCAKSNWELSGIDGSPGKVPENNNRTGFAALPGGRRLRFDGGFENIGKSGYWWSSTGFGNYTAYRSSLHYAVDGLGVSYVEKEEGYSVRLVKD